jgi:hypothetical protein
MCGVQEQCSSYELWKEYTGGFIPNVHRMQKAVSGSSKPKLEIVITETGISPANDILGRRNNTYKALWWFEVLMNEIATKNVSYVYNWGSHSPWGGPIDRDNDAAVLLRMDNNKRKPTGEIIRIVNSHLLDRMMEATRARGHVRTYATSNDSGSKLNIFLMNKNNSSEDIIIKLKNDSVPSRSFSRATFKGQSPDDRAPDYEEYSPVSESADTIRLQLPPLSLTVLKQINRRGSRTGH